MSQSAREYLRSLENDLRAGDATEHTHRPALKTFLESLATGLTATNEPRQRTDCGAPDMVLRKRPGPVTLGYVEAKDIGVSLADVSRTNQLKRYRNALPNLVLTNYVDFKWFVDGDLRADASLGSADLNAGRINTTPGTIEATLDLLENVLAHEPTPIARPKDLAEHMARLAHMIRDIVVEAFAAKRASSLIVDLRKAMADALIPDLEEPTKTGQFADLYAQTLTYGLFAARCNHPSDAGEFTRHSAASSIPRTNPFLRELFETITGTKLDAEPYAGFVDDLVSILAHSDIEEILKDFGSKTFQQDPVLHFYETFLATYDPRLREARGVYYTPEPVVQYIVRSVDHLLKTHFDIPEGLADTGKVTYEHVTDKKKDGEHIVEKRESHRTLILDPACGTGTFLYSAVNHIRDRFRTMKRAGQWSTYVGEHLLPRLFGFELLMAPYAVAHLKLGMQLAGQDLPESNRDTWAYDFAADQRLGVYLTNTLESVERHVQQMLGPFRIISEEAAAAARIKREMPILVVLGNPPYSGISSNQGAWIVDLLKGKAPGEATTANYYEVDGEPLGEKKVWLQDDYVKFIRWAQWRLDKTGQGVLAFITNHGYLDNPTFRGMRQALMHSFDEIYILDLHGNLKKKEVTPDGSPDRNVFDIQQGVAIGLFVKKPGKNRQRSARVHHADLWGTRDEKYPWLIEHSVENTDWTELEPATPYYLFRPYATTAAEEYEAWPSLPDVMPVNVTGIVTARDHFVIDIDRDALLKRMEELRSDSASNEALRQKYFAGKGSSKYPAGDTRSWKLPKARETLREDKRWKQRVAPIRYRPFDDRFIYYVPWMVDWPRTEAMPHLDAGENLGLNVCRQCIDSTWAHTLVTDRIIDDSCVSNRTRERGYMFPLYLYPNVGKVDQHTFEHWPEGQDGRRPNLDPGFVKDLSGRLGLSFIPDGRGDLKKTFGPEDVLHYIYAVFHSPTYRERYAEFLKLDFPRVPLTSDRDLFARLCQLGEQVMNLHLLEDAPNGPPVTGESIGYPIAGDNTVERGYPKYVPPKAEPVKAGTHKLESDDTHGRVYISPAQYFEGVEPDVWTFQIGGYQVAEKWLKDRRGRTLTHDDITHYARTLEALRETMRLMQEIDDAIPEWPLS